MSVRGLIEVAAERDQGVPTRLESKVEPPSTPETTVAGIVTTIEPGSDQRLTMRWIIFGVTAAFIAIWMVAAHLRGQGVQKRKLPLTVIACAVIAFAAWGLVMPESPLGAQLSATNRTVGPSSSPPSERRWSAS